MHLTVKLFKTKHIYIFIDYGFFNKGEGDVSLSVSNLFFNGGKADYLSISSGT